MIILSCSVAAVAKASTAEISIGGTSQVVVPCYIGPARPCYRYITDDQTSEIGLSGC